MIDNKIALDLLIFKDLMNILSLCVLIIANFDTQNHLCIKIETQGNQLIVPPDILNP